MEKRYKEIDGVRYQVIQNTILGSNVVPVGESLPEVTASDSGKLLGVDSSGEWVPVDAPSDLPEVTSADAGDVLTVNASGEWEAAAPGGGGGVEEYLVTYSINGETLTCDKSFAEIKTAWEAGKKLVTKSQNDGAYGWDYYVLAENGGGMTNPFTKAIFTSVSYPNDSCKIRIIKHTAAAITEVQKSIQ